MSTRTKPFGPLSAFAGLLLIAAAAGCMSPDEEEVESAEGAATAGTEGYASTVWATPSWADRKAWYTTTQGSHLVEYDVMLAVERAGSEKPFAERENLESFGFVYPVEGGLTASSRLPIGVLKDRNAAEGRDYAGLSCAACHTGEIRTNGKRILVDGGQSFIEVEAFFGGLQKALAETTTSPAKNARFCVALGDPRTKCNERLKSAKERVDAIQSRNVLTLEGGAGRMDAIGRILNEVFAGQLGGEKAQPVAVPVSIPHVWDASRLSCVQTNCLSRNSFTRNVGEVLGVFGHVALNGTKTTTSAKAANLYALEKSLESLKSPKWSTEAFGRIDESKRARGQTLFGSKCASCHTEPYKLDSNGRSPADSIITETGAGRQIALWKVTTTPYKKVATDPAFIEIHGARVVKKPELTALFDDVVRNALARKLDHDPDSLVVKAAFDVAKLKLHHDGIRNLDGTVSALAMLGAVTTSLETTLLPQLQRGRDLETTQREVEFYRAPEGDLDFTSYRARPLNGIAFTGPFGHNGAWPTLRDMLEREENRPRQFPVRPRSFDPKRVGIDTSPARPGERLFLFDTSKRGNLRTGHTYGTELSPDEKDALVEYMKSI
jgi:mono/diheme cytochrome c family protein